MLASAIPLTPTLSPRFAGGEGDFGRRLGAVTPKVQASSARILACCASLRFGSPANHAANSPARSRAANISATVRTCALSFGGPWSGRILLLHHDGQTSAKTICALAGTRSPVSNGQIRARSAQRGSLRNRLTTGIPVKL